MLAVVGGWVTACAAPTMDDKKPVDVEIWVIRATTKNDKVSAELRDLADALKKQFKYTGFELAKKLPGRAELGKSFSGSLLASYKATVTPKEREGNRVKLQLVVTTQEDKKQKTVLNVTATHKAGPLVPYGCGSLAGGDYLIIAVRVR
jgi:hypothetical protein